MNMLKRTGDNANGKNDGAIDSHATIPTFYDKEAVLTIELNDEGTNFYVNVEQSQHINVMRKKPGDIVDIVDGNGKRVRSKIVKVTKQRVDLVAEKITLEHRPYPRISLILPLIEESRFEQMLEIATELKVNKILPWQANRSTINKLKKTPAQIDKMYARWRSKVIASVNQSRSSFVPEIYGVVNSKGLAQVIKDLTVSHSSHVFLLHENAKETLADSIQKIDKTRRFSIIVGPEGSFDDSELEQFTANGAIPVLLTNEILRVSTAVATALSYIRLALPDKRYDANHAPEFNFFDDRDEA